MEMFSEVFFRKKKIQNSLIHNHDIDNKAKLSIKLAIVILRYGAIKKIYQVCTKT